MADLEREAGDNRRLVLACIKDHPGITKSEMRDRLGLAWGTVCHHVDRLLAERAVEVLPDRGRVRVYEAGIPAHERRWYGILRDTFSRDVAHLVLSSRSARTYEIADRLGASRRVVARHLEQMQQAGLLDCEGVVEPRYSIADPCRSFVDGFLEGGR